MICHGSLSLPFQVSTTRGTTSERSVSQICELLLRAGVDAYKKKGHKYLQRLLSHARRMPPSNWDVLPCDKRLCFLVTENALCKREYALVRRQEVREL